MNKRLVSILTLLFVYFITFSQEKLEKTDLNTINKQIADLKEDDNYHQNSLELYDKISPNDSIYPDVMVTKSYHLIQLEKFEEALKIIDISFTLKGISKESLYLNKGVCFESLEKYDEAIGVYNEALKEYPYNGSFYYNRAVIYQNKKEYQKATEDYFNCIRLSPLNTKAYYKLGTLYYSEKKMTQALMALNMYLLFDPDGENALQALKTINTSFSRNNDSKPIGNTITNDDIAFKELDLILDNGIALNKKYKVDSKIEAAFVKQNHLLLEEIKDIDTDASFWGKRFLKFYAWINETNNFDNFIYTMCFSIEDQKAKKHIDKNKNELIQFLSTAIAKWEEILSPDNTDLSGKSSEVVNYLYEDNIVNATGIIKDEKKLGIWNVFDENGKFEGSGAFNDKGQKEGLWNWYYTNDNGINIKENYKDNNYHGETKVFHKNGQLKYKVGYLEGQPEGTYTEFDTYGIKTSEKFFKDGKLHGNYLSFYNLKDSKYFEGEYVEGKLQGGGTFFYDSGQYQVKLTYADDLINGERKEYYRDGSIKVESQFVEGNLNGIYTEYYKDGTIKEKYNYVNGELEGEGIVNYRDGGIQLRMNYSSGKLNGSYKEYDVDGKLYYDYGYKNGLIVSCTYFDKKGEIISDVKKKGKGIDFKGYSSLGELTTKGLYNIKGGKDGDWEFYEDGVLNNKSYYKDGNGEGKTIWYYRNGAVKTKAFYKEDKFDGYYVSYYSNGQMQEQGYYDNGKFEGTWLTYYHDGTLESENFYHNDKKNGISKSYATSGKIYYKGYYDFDILLKEEYYKENGEIFETLDYSTKASQYQLTYHHFNGKLHSELDYFGEEKHGKYKRYFFNGGIYIEGQYFYGKKQGDWKEYNEKGDIVMEYQYFYGDKVGKWEYFFDNGKLKRESNYIDNLEQGKTIVYNEDGVIVKELLYKDDELHGTYKTYSSDGKLQLVRYYHMGKLTSYSYEDSAGELVDPIMLENGTGKIKAFFASGKPSAEIEYKNRVRVGSFKLYNSNGGVYKNLSYNSVGNYDGKNEVFYSEGKPQLVENYLNGILHGKQKIYHKNGKLKSEINYVNGSKSGDAKYYNLNGDLTHTRKYFNNLITEQTNF